MSAGRGLEKRLLERSRKRSCAQA
uniref:Uncharacterized protein n=1 Tax=Arundo donax TaxID=35708 RepID=A0A0A9BJL8_ARUDO